MGRWAVRLRFPPGIAPTPDRRATYGRRSHAASNGSPGSVGRCVPRGIRRAVGRIGNAAFRVGRRRPVGQGTDSTRVGRAGLGEGSRCSVTGVRNRWAPTVVLACRSRASGLRGGGAGAGRSLRRRSSSGGILGRFWRQSARRGQRLRIQIAPEQEDSAQDERCSGGIVPPVVPRSHLPEALESTAGASEVRRFF